MKLFSRIFSMLVAAFAFSVLFCAPTFAEESLSISVDGVAEVEATPNVLGTASADVYVTSTARDGYKLSISDSDENNSLVSSNGNSINPLAESVTESNFTTNAWGVKVGDNFLPVPKLSDNVLDLATTSAPATNEKHTVTFGMKVDGTVTSGAYSSEVVFTAVANPLVVRKTTLQKGTTVNAAWKTLANNSSTTYKAADNKITSVQKFTGDFTDTLRNAAIDIATDDSGYPVYSWFDNDIIYYYTEADEVFFNADSSYMFFSMGKLASVDFNFGVETDVDPDGDGYIASAQDPVYITSSVTDMGDMFLGASALTSLDVSRWDTSSVTNMDGMFYSASSLTSLDVSRWNTSSVTDMGSMFASTSHLTSLDVSRWNTSSVTDMGSMFREASSLTSLNVSNWNTGSVTEMYSMFRDASSLATLDVSRWNTSSVTDMLHMFSGASSLAALDVSNWDTSKVTGMIGMFSNASSLASLDVSRWNTSKVTDMDSMFWYASSLTSLDVSKWDTSSVANMSNMFSNASSLTSLDVSNWDTSKVTRMYNMFDGASALISIDVSNWDTSKVTNMRYMFSDTSSLTSLDVSNWDTGSVTVMDSMFSGASSLTSLDVSNWDTSKVTDMGYMFYNALSLTTIYASDKFDTSAVTRSDRMFTGASKLVGGNGTVYSANHIDKEYARIDAPGTPGYFTAPRAIRKATLQTGKQVNAAWKKFSIGNNATSNYRDSVITSIQKFTGTFTEALQNAAVDIATEGSDYPVYTWLNNDTIYYYTEADEVFLNADSSYMFYYFTKLVSIDLNFDGEIALDPDQDGLITITRDTIFNTLNVTDMNCMFNGAYSLAAVDVSKWDTGKVTNMRGLFWSAKSLSTIDVSNWNTSNVTNMYAMFEDTSSLAALDVSKWDTSKVTDMSYMFQSASSLTALDVSNWDTSKVTDMSYMFLGASSLTALDLSGLDTGSVTNMSYMFLGDRALTTLNVSSWDTSNVTNMNNMFYDTSALTSLDVSKWNTGNVTNMHNLFYGARTLTTLDLTGWDTSKVTDMSYMFYNMSSLTTIYASDRFDTSSVSSSAQMFLGADNLVGGNGTVFSADHREKEYARIDTATTPGYFTAKPAGN